MLIQAFVDESGSQNQNKNFVLAGLVSEATGWAQFSDEWRACLDQAPSIPAFKMRDAAKLSGHFGSFKRKERDEKITALAAIINRHVRFVMYAAVDMESHGESWGGKNLPKPMNEIYFWPYHVMIMGLCMDLWDHGIREPFEIIFDNQEIFGLRARKFYPMVAEIMRIKYPEESKILPVDPMFKPDDQFLPLQAADFFAYCLRRNTDNPDEELFHWTLPLMQNVKLSSYASYFDADRMQKIARLSDDALRNDALVRALHTKFGDLFS